MRIHCQAEHDFPCSAPAVFELMVDPVRFPATFRGYGLIPAIRSISLDGPLAVGVLRRIHNADGTTLTEQVTALDKPLRHAYTLGGFRPPFSWLVKRGEATWSLGLANESTTRVHWHYRFMATSVLAYPMASLLLRIFMTHAMQRCLENMATLLADSASKPAVTA